MQLHFLLREREIKMIKKMSSDYQIKEQDKLHYFNLLSEFWCNRTQSFVKTVKKNIKSD